MGNGINKNIRFLFDSLLEVIFCGDGKCIICKNPLYGDEDICNNCKKKIMVCKDQIFIEYNKRKIKCLSAAYYSKVVMELVIKLKYKKDFKCAEVLAGLMVNTFRENSISADYITFVPTSKEAFKKRGYNQSMLLAKIISRETGTELIDSLVKADKAKDQIGLGKKGRFENIKGSISYKCKKEINNCRILLIDDVVTTGATAYWCAESLIKNGALEVMVLTAAKSDV